MKINKLILMASLIFSSLLFSSFDIFDYKKAWKEVEASMDKGLPKTALKQIDAIYDQAFQESNEQQQLKATISRTKLVLNTKELGLEAVVTNLESKIEQSDRPVKQILQSIAAELFSEYYNSQYYKVSQRTDLDDFDTGDIRTWAPNNYRDYISGKYLKSLEGDLDIYKTEDYKELLRTTDNVDYELRPTLRHLLADRAIEYFSRRNRVGITPSFSFKLDDVVYLSGIEKFVNYNIETVDESSTLYKATLLYQRVLKNALDNKDQKLLADYDLKRLDFVRSNSSMANSDEEFYNALTQASQFYKGQNVHVFLLRLAQYAIGKGEYQKGLDLANEILAGDPLEYMKGFAENLIISINEKSLFLNAEQVVTSKTNFLVNVTSRNVDKIYFRIHKVDDQLLSDIYNTKRNEQQTKISKLPVARTWSRDNIKDGYKPSSYEEIVEGLDYGQYIIVASNESGFSGGNAAFIYAGFYVSDLAYSTYSAEAGKKMLVRDRKSGKPIHGAHVEVYTRKYNNQRRKYELSKVQTLITDEEGWAFINAVKNSSFSYGLSLGEDVLNLEMYDYNRRINPKKYQTTRTEIFTDRAIYRPGQTVHFKTLSLKIDNEGVPSIRPSQQVEIRLNDANGQEVEMLNLVSNEFGSTTGSFVLPVGRLTGLFSIYAEHGTKSIRVEEYKRPKFEVTIDPQESQIQIGDNITVVGAAKALSGSSISDAKVSYTIMKNTYYGWWGWYRRTPNKSAMIKQGEVKTDLEGKFNFDFDATADKDIEVEKNPTYSYQISVDVTDLAGETRSSQTTLSVSVLPYAYVLDLDELVDIQDLDKVNLSASTTSDVKVQSKAQLRIVELEQPDKWKKPRLWAAPANPIYRKGEFDNKIDRIGFQPTSQLANYPEKETIVEKTIEITQEGIQLDIAQYITGGKAYKIEIISDQDFDGQKVKETKYIAVSDFKKNRYPNLNLMYSKPLDLVGKVGEEYDFKLGTSDPELIVYYRILRDRKVIYEGMADVDNDYTISYKPTQSDQGGVTLTMDYLKHNYHRQESHNIQIPWSNKELDVELITKRDKVLPGSKEEWQIKITGPGKDKVAAEILATMYDASLDQFVAHQYAFNPYPSHFGHNNGQFYGFGNANSNSLNYKWNRTQAQRITQPVLPMLKGLNFGYYGGISIRGSRSEGTVRYTDGVRVQSREKMAAPASAGVMDEVVVVEEEAMQLDAVVVDNNAGNVAGVSSSPAPPKKEISIRKNLNESVFFYPNLKTDKEGNILISFTMNEALTSWKLLTFAHDKDLRYGMTSHEVKTQKDLMIVPNAPRFLREGDRMVFPATISNLSDKDIEVDAELELLDPITDQPLNQKFSLVDRSMKVSVAKGESVRVDWELNIPMKYKKLVKYRVIASSGDHTDGEENVLPVVTNQVLVTDTKVISVKKKEEKTFTFDALSNQSTTSQPHRYTFEYTSNPVWYAVQALPYLMEYPHRCTEQIFNRLYANTMASHIANTDPRIKAVFDQWKSLDSDVLISNLEKNEELKSAILSETPWVRNAQSETEQKKRIALLFDLNKMSQETQSVLNELKLRQMASGAFSWFDGGRENVYITQNIVEGIAHLQHLGILNEKDYEFTNILNKAIVYLDEQVKKRYEKLEANITKYGGDINKDHLDHLSIHYLYVRSFYKDTPVPQASQKAYNYYLGQSKKYWLGKGLYSEAMIGLTLKRSNAKECQDIAKSLRERSFYSEELGRYWNIGNGFNWHELPIESHAMMIEFFTEVESEKDFVEDMKIWLLKNKQTNHWKTTKATSAAIYSLLIQGEKEGMITWLAEDNKPMIKVGNQVLKTKEGDLEAGTGYIKKAWAEDEITTDLGNITIKNNNETIAWGAAYYQYFEDLDKVDEFTNTPLKITRNLFKEKMTDRGPKLVSLENTPITPGDRVIVRIEIKVDRSMSYVHLKDMRSSGFEPENVLSGYRWKGGLGYYESTRDMASHFFISQLNKGTYVFEYPVRAVHKGEFSTGITSIQCMYAPEFTSHSDGGRITVQ